MDIGQGGCCLIFAYKVDLAPMRVEALYALLDDLNTITRGRDARSLRSRFNAVLGEHVQTRRLQELFRAKRTFASVQEEPDYTFVAERVPTT